MPLLRYFVVVGGTLLALLLISDVALPRQPLPAPLNATSSVLPPFRIHSDQKWPERIVFDTSMPLVKAAAAGEVTLAATRPAADAASQTARLSDAFAQLAPVARKTGATSGASITPIVSKVREVKPPAKRKVAKARPLVRVAQR